MSDSSTSSSSTANQHTTIELYRAWDWWFDGAVPRGATAAQYEKSVKHLGTFSTVQVRATRHALETKKMEKKKIGNSSGVLVDNAALDRIFGGSGTTLRSKSFRISAICACSRRA